MACDECENNGWCSSHLKLLSEKNKCSREEEHDYATCSACNIVKNFKDITNLLNFSSDDNDSEEFDEETDAAEQTDVDHDDGYHDDDDNMNNKEVREVFGMDRHMDGQMNTFSPLPAHFRSLPVHFRFTSGPFGHHRWSYEASQL